MALRRYYAKGYDTMKIDFLIKQKVSWLVFFLLSFLLYLLYYQGIYQAVLSAYSQQVQTRVYQCSETGAPDKTKAFFNCENFLIHVYFPKNLDNSGKQSVFLSVENKSQYDFDGELHLALIRTAQEQPGQGDMQESDVSDGSSEIEKSGASDVFDNGIIFPVLIAELSTPTQKIDISIKSTATYYIKQDVPYPGSILKNTNYNMAVFLQNENQTLQFLPELDLATLEVKPINSTIYILTEKILLPPWANIILPILAAFCVWILEDRVFKGKEQTDIRLYDFLRLFFPSCILASLILITVGISIYQNSIFAFMLFPLVLVVFWWLIQNPILKFHEKIFKKIKASTGWQKRLYLGLVFVLWVGFVAERVDYFGAFFINLSLRNGQITQSDFFEIGFSIGFGLLILITWIMFLIKGEVKFNIPSSGKAKEGNSKFDERIELEPDTVYLQSRLEQLEKVILTNFKQASQEFKENISECCSNDNADSLAILQLREQIIEIQKSLPNALFLEKVEMFDSLKLLPDALKLIQELKVSSRRNSGDVSQKDREFLESKISDMVAQIEKLNNERMLAIEKKLDKLIDSSKPIFDLENRNGDNQIECKNCHAMIPKDSEKCPSCGEDPFIEKKAPDSAS